MAVAGGEGENTEESLNQAVALGAAAWAAAAWAEVAMVGAISGAGAAPAVLPTARPVGCLAVAAKAVRAAVARAGVVTAQEGLARGVVVRRVGAAMDPEGLARAVGAAKALGALGAASEVEEAPAALPTVRPAGSLEVAGREAVAALGAAAQVAAAWAVAAWAVAVKASDGLERAVVAMVARRVAAAKGPANLARAVGVLGAAAWAAAAREGAGKAWDGPARAGAKAAWEVEGGLTVLPMVRPAGSLAAAAKEAVAA